MSDGQNPGKSKKKKRSFFDDDDFFVKKPRSRSPKVAPNSASGKPEASTHEHRNVGKNHASSDTCVLSSEDTTHAYFSASESFNELDIPPFISSKSENEQSSLDYGKEPTKTSQIPAASPPMKPISLNDELSPENGATRRTRSSFPLDPNAELELTPKRKYQVLVKDDDEYIDSDLKEFFSNIAQKKAEIDDEHERIYRVIVTSRLGQPLKYEKHVTGDTTFAQLVDRLSHDTLREHGIPDYWAHGSLVWIEGRSELKPFFKPSTLRIAPPPGNSISKISCLYIPTEHVANFERLYPEFEEKTEEDEFPEGDSAVFVLSDEDEQITEANKEESEKSEKSQYFVIGLKGKDNKRIEAEVGPTTQIRSLLKYYMQVKGIPETRGLKGKVLFDDEELDLDAVVGDTELEEDFEVQVHI